MKKWVLLIIFNILLIGIYPSCISLTTPSQGWKFMRDSLDNVPIVENILSEDEKNNHEYRVSIPLYRW